MLSQTSELRLSGDVLPLSGWEAVPGILAAWGCTAGRPSLGAPRAAAGAGHLQDPSSVGGRVVLRRAGRYRGRDFAAHVPGKTREVGEAVGKAARGREDALTNDSGGRSSSAHAAAASVAAEIPAGCWEWGRRGDPRRVPAKANRCRRLCSRSCHSG